MLPYRYVQILEKFGSDFGLISGQRWRFLGPKGQKKGVLLGYVGEIKTHLRPKSPAKDDANTLRKLCTLTCILYCMESWRKGTDR